MIDDPAGFLRLALNIRIPRWQERLLRKLAYKKIEGLRAEAVTAHINEALKEMDE